MARGKIEKEIPVEHGTDANWKKQAAAWPTNGFYKECKVCERLFDKTGQPITNDTDPSTVQLFASMIDMNLADKLCKECKDAAGKVAD